MSSSGAAVASTAGTSGRLPDRDGRVVLFVCENCGRPGFAPSSGARRRPELPDFSGPLPVQPIAVPCAGRLQPEHLLKILEDGADGIGVVCCEDGNCHHLEGNRRCRRRLDYVSRLVAEAGLDGGRLQVFVLPGSAAEDMALGSGASPVADPLLGQKVAVVREAFWAWREQLAPSPLRRGDLPDEYVSEVESNDESDE
jgi:F420-non-reducing hydrogenase iron-sulfur subunit